MFIFGITACGVSIFGIAAFFVSQIEQRKLEWKAQPKVGSLENAQHTPGGGEKKVTMETRTVNYPVFWHAAVFSTVPVKTQCHPFLFFVFKKN